MEQQVKILLYEEEHKSKNGTIFENLISGLFKQQGYIIDKNINFTGLEIDIFAQHIVRINEKIVIECKAKKKPQSTEIKNFIFNVGFGDFTYGYFLYTEELDHQAGGLVKEIMQKPEYNKKVAFIGPAAIISLLEGASFIKYLDPKMVVDDSFIVHKMSLLYTYFGVFYLLYFGEGNKSNYFCLINAKDLGLVIDISSIADDFHSKLTIEQVLRTSISDLANIKYRVPSKSSVLAQVLVEKGVESFVEMREEFVDYLMSMGASFAHSQVDEISLDDVFVWPNVRKLDSVEYKKKAKSAVESLGDIYNTLFEDRIRMVLLGEENSGKSALAKYLSYSYYHEGYIPLLIRGGDIKAIRQDEIVKMLSSVFREQYKTELSLSEFDKNRIVVIIDDFHKMSAKNQFKVVFMKNLTSAFKNVLATGSNVMPLEVLFKNEASRNVFDEFEVYTILEFGPKLRNELVEKWNSIGVDSSFVDINDVFRKNDYANSQINSILGKNYIPAYPFYLLTILQAVESANTQKPDYSLHGFYYELLINDALSKAVEDKKEISLFYNYITNLCFFLYESQIESISINELSQFHENYCNTFDLNYNFKKMLATLSAASLIDVNGFVRVSYKYVYYFFVAKHLTNNMHKQESRDLISKMCKRVYRDEYANIIMFLTHLSKDSFIVNELMQNAKSLFSDLEISKLDSDIAPINSLIKDLPKQVLEVLDARDVREEHMYEQEEIERLEKEYDESDAESLNIDEDVSTIDVMSKMVLALKTIEILGQVAKKYWGEMTGEMKQSIVSQTYFLGLRTLNYVLSQIANNKEAVVSEIVQMINKGNGRGKIKLEQSVEESVGQYVFRVCYMATYGTIKRISTSVGYDKLKPTFENVLAENQYNSIKLINLSINLDHYERFPYKDISDGKKELKSNYLAYMVMQNLVINYMYMFSTDYKLKSRICNLLGIEMKEQRFIQATSSVKRV